MTKFPKEDIELALTLLDLIKDSVSSIHALCVGDLRAKAISSTMLKSVSALAAFLEKKLSEGNHVS